MTIQDTKGLDATAAEGDCDDRLLPFPVVAVGASAGGLQALEELFTGLPDGLGAAFVVITHLEPTHKSLLSEILSKFTRMTVREAEQDMRLAPDVVHVIPSGKAMTLARGALQLRERGGQAHVHHPIDAFCASLAENQGSRTFCVILSGAGTDGTAGARKLQEAGGVVIVQDANTAAHAGMPRSAAESGVADVVLPLDEIPAWLARHLRAASGLDTFRSEAGEEDGAEHLKKLFGVLRGETGHEFSTYKASAIGRRIQKRMLLAGVSSLFAYVALVERDQAERTALFHDLLIGVTKFFRDREAFDSLRLHVLPEIFKGKGAGDVVRIWVAGCSTGEEAYSLAILAAEHLERVEVKPDVKILATDIDKQAVDAARRGVYPASIAEDAPPALLEKYFTRGGDEYSARPELRDLIIFAHHDLLRDPPFFRLDLVVCRNLLIYLKSEAQKKILSLFYYALNQDGRLFLGPSETIGGQTGLFVPLDRKWRIFKRLDGGDRKIQFPLQSLRPLLIGAQWRSPPERHVGQSDATAVMEKALAARYGKSSALIDDELNVVRIHGDMGKHMALPQGDASLNIYKLVGKGLRLYLRSALGKALETRRAVEMRNLRVDDENRLVTLIVDPLERDDGGLNYLVIFEDAQEPKPMADATAVVAMSETAMAARLEDELEATRRQLQEAVDSFDSVNEELKFSNEELMSMNEELQSSYEELETSKEELQALNEELTIMNSELQAKLEELADSNNYLENLFRSTNVATIFLDRELRILRFTPAAAELFHLIEADAQRPIGHFASMIQGLDIPGRVRLVVQTRQAFEQEARAQDGRWYLIRFLPFRTPQNDVEGAALTFVDITQLKSAEEALKSVNQDLERRVEERTAELRQAKDEAERQEEKYRTLLERLPEVVVGRLGADSRYVYISPNVVEVTGVPPDAFLGRRPEDLPLPGGLGPLLGAAVRRAFEEGVESAFQHALPTGAATFHREFRVAPETSENGAVKTVIIVSYDITALKRLEADLRQAMEVAESRAAELQAIFGSMSEGVIAVDRDGRMSMNPASAELLGFASVQDALERLEAYPDLFEARDASGRLLSLAEWPLSRALAGETVTDLELDIRRKDTGRAYTANHNATPLPGAGNGVARAVMTVTDVTKRAEAEKALRESEELYRGLFQNSHAVMLLIDPETLGVVDANPAACAYYGYTAEQCREMSVDRINARPVEEIRSLMASAGALEENRFEFKHRLSSGELRDVEVYSGPVLIKSRRLLYSLVHDITERKLAEKRLGMALHAAKSGIWEWDLRTNENVWSEELWKLYGLKPHSREPSYETWLQTVHPEDREMAARLAGEAASQGADLNGEWRVLGPDGAVRWLMARGRPEFDVDGQVIRYSGIVLDITERRRLEEELREREEHLRLFVEYAPAAMAMLDKDMRYVAVSNRWQDDYGLERRDLLGRSHYEIFPEIPERWKEIHRLCLAGAVRRAEEDPFLRADGRTQWLRWEVRPWYAASEVVGGIVVFSEDVTERVEARNRLQESQAKLEAALASMTDAVLISDAQGRFTHFNDAFATFHRFDNTEECSRTFAENPDILDVFLENGEPAPVERWAVARALGGEVATNAEYILRRKDTGETWFGSYSFSPIRDMNGEIVGAVVVGRDVSERIRMENALRESEERYRSIFEASLDAVLLASPDGSILAANKAAQELFGMTEEEVLAAKREEVLDTLDPRLAEFLKVRDRDGRATGELRYRRKDGALFTGEVSSVLFSDLKGQTRTASIIRDVTERKRMEERLREAKRTAEAANLAKSEFLANMSHEIRTPMNGIIGMTELALMNTDDVKIQEYLKLARQSARHLMEIIGDILDFSRIEAGKIELDRKPFNLRDMLDAVLTPLTMGACEKGLLLEDCIAPDAPEVVVGDQTRLRQVLINLISNAIKFTEAGEIRVGVTCGREPGLPEGKVQLDFSVSDSGMGISEEDRQRIFEKFTHVESAAHIQHGGAGLGLAISRSLVEIMGGSLGVRSAVGQGSEFFFSLALDVIKESRLPEAKETSRANREAVALNILLAEDDKVNSTLAATFLRQRGHAVTIAGNGLEALAALAKERFDVVLMDVRMPVLGGEETTRIIRENPPAGVDPKTPIIALTAHALKEDRERFLAAGMNDYISKPVDLEGLARLVARVAGERRGQAGASATGRG